MLAGIIEALVSAANDRDEAAQGAIFKAVMDIGSKKHTVVLNACHAFLVKHTKVQYACMVTAILTRALVFPYN